MRSGSPTLKLFSETKCLYMTESERSAILYGIKKDIEIQTFQTALKEYMSSKDKKLGTLISYAREFGIEDNVRTYTEVLL